MDFKVLLLFILYLVPTVIALVGVRKKNRKVFLAGLVPLIYLLISAALDCFFA